MGSFNRYRIDGHADQAVNWTRSSRIILSLIAQATCRTVAQEHELGMPRAHVRHQKPQTSSNSLVITDQRSMHIDSKYGKASRTPLPQLEWQFAGERMDGQPYSTCSSWATALRLIRTMHETVRYGQGKHGNVRSLVFRSTWFGIEKATRCDLLACQSA